MLFDSVMNTIKEMSKSYWIFKPAMVAYNNERNERNERNET